MTDDRRATAQLAPPFRWAGEHIGCALPGARVLFTTRRGGVSAAPYDTLNLGVLTDDDRAAVDANRERLAAAIGIARERTLQGLQVHGTVVRRARELPAAGAELERADGQATALRGRRRGRADGRLPAGRDRRRGRGRDRPRGLARARRRRARGGRAGAARARRGR